jgi:5-methylcytosine-specific restriction endonuclease McrA
MKKPTKAKLRQQADKLLQDYIRTKHKDELCWVCGIKPISCGHHFFPCSNSNATRYYLPNIIPICRDCHSRVHTQPHLVEPVISFKLGKDWYDDLLETKRQGVKANLEWYTNNLSFLENLMGGS